MNTQYHLQVKVMNRYGESPLVISSTHYSNEERIARLLSHISWYMNQGFAVCWLSYEY
jgi:hypothetical protein